MISKMKIVMQVYLNDKSKINELFNKKMHMKIKSISDIRSKKLQVEFKRGEAIFELSVRNDEKLELILPDNGFPQGAKISTTFQKPGNKESVSFNCDTTKVKNIKMVV
ncbi:hypothetical protein OGZ37_03875 [Lactococcus lactis]|uniref:hypothetical protein n=1 Tax=Lactococcus lactis TaxID=1358 RepID=UPI002418A149|nr:hypothetical protein [Lactococcus lactis]MDG4965716.1 hypothetical protein [Lactococcus lactis]